MAGRVITGQPLADALTALTGHAFQDPARLDRALTHASARNNPRHGSVSGDYERLEFLGDRVLGLAVAELLFREFPEADEGEMSVRLNALVRTETLAELADEIGVTDHIRTGLEMAPRAARKQKNLKADVMEALIATIYLDGGMGAVAPFITRFWAGRARHELADRRDAKTELQEWSHQNLGQPPLYQMRDREGPDHAPVFTVSVSLSDGKTAHGTGRSKRDAEQSAARALLLAAGLWTE